MAGESLQKRMEEDIRWDPGVVESLKKYHLTDHTINILGTEGFTSFGLIDTMSYSTVQELTSTYNLKLAQKCALNFMIDDRIKGPFDEQSPVVVKAPSHGHVVVMSGHYQEVLTASASTLGTMVSDPIPIISSLFSQKIITQTDLDFCIQRESHAEKMLCLVNILLGKSDKAYTTFIRALDIAGEDRAVNFLAMGKTGISKGKIKTCTYVSKLYNSFMSSNFLQIFKYEMSMVLLITYYI